MARDLRETGPPPCSLKPAAHQNPGTLERGTRRAPGRKAQLWGPGSMEVWMSERQGFKPQPRLLRAA